MKMCSDKIIDPYSGTMNIYDDENISNDNIINNPYNAAKKSIDKIQSRLKKSSKIIQNYCLTTDFTEYKDKSIMYIFNLLSKWNHILQDTEIPDINKLARAIKTLFDNVKKHMVMFLNNDEIRDFYNRGEFFMVIFNEHLETFFNEFQCWKIMSDEDRIIWKNILLKDFEKFDMQ